MAKDIGVGILGVGSMGTEVLHINRVEDSRLVVRGICDPNEELLATKAKGFDIPFAAASYDELLEHEGIDVIGVFTPDRLHCEQVLKALDAGKHVIVTKPMVNTLHEAEQVVAAAREAGRKLLVAETERFSPVNIAAKELVDGGTIGRPTFVQASYVHDMRSVLERTPWREDPTNKDFLVGAACHAVDLVVWFGGDVDEVFAYANDSGTLPGRKGHNNFVVNLKFKNGAIGRVLALFGIVRPPSGLGGLGVCCTKGSLVGRKYSVDTPDGVVERDLEIRKDERTTGHGALRFMRHMEDCILNDRQPIIDAVEGAKTVAVSCAALESIRTGKPAAVRTEF